MLYLVNILVLTYTLLIALATYVGNLSYYTLALLAITPQLVLLIKGSARWPLPILPILTSVPTSILLTNVVASYVALTLLIPYFLQYYLVIRLGNYRVGPQVTTLATAASSAILLTSSVVNEILTPLSLIYLAEVAVINLMMLRGVKSLVIEVPKVRALLKKDAELYITLTHKAVANVGIKLSINDLGVVKLLSHDISTNVPAGNVVRVRLNLTPLKLGNYLLPINVIAWDYTGILRIRFTKYLDITVEPRINELTPLIRELIISGGEGFYVSEAFRKGASGAAGDYYGVREYVPGDSIKLIHWKKSLQMRELIVKEFTAAGVLPTIILVYVEACSAEDVDETLYNFLRLVLRLCYVGTEVPTALVALSSGGLIASKFSNPTNLLLTALKVIKMSKVINNGVKCDYVMEPYQINLIPNELRDIVIKSYRYSFMKSPFLNAVNIISNLVKPPAEVFVIVPKSMYIHEVMYLSHLLRTSGYEVSILQ